MSLSVVVPFVQQQEVMSMAIRKQQAISIIVTLRVQVFAKGAKFSMFKPAEEMVYIGLDEESRTKGKAAIDVVGAQSGKSAGSVLQQVTPRFPDCTCCKHPLSASILSGSFSLRQLQCLAHRAHC